LEKSNNNGSNEYKSVQFRWSKSWTNHNIVFNATWQDSKTSNDNYNDNYGLEELEDIVIFEGKPVKRHELPRHNFNRPCWPILADTLTICFSLRYSNRGV
jgi:hypothetical protein